MKHEDVIDDFIWLDDAFSKGLVNAFEAACCFAGCNPGTVKISIMNDYLPSSANILNEEVKRLYDIVAGLAQGKGNTLLWYIEQAVIRNIRHVKFELLFAKCKESEYRKNEIIKNYPELAKKLGIPEQPLHKSDDTMSDEDVESRYLANPKERNERLFKRGVEIAREMERRKEKI